MFVVTQLPGRYYTVTKGVAVKRGSYQNGQQLKAVTKLKLVFCKTFSLCLPTFINLPVDRRRRVNVYKTSIRRR